MDPQRLIELWSRLLDDEALSPAEEQEMTDCLSNRAALLNDLLADESVDSLLKNLERIERGDDRFVERVLHHTAALTQSRETAADETTSPPDAAGESDAKPTSAWSVNLPLAHVAQEAIPTSEPAGDDQTLAIHIDTDTVQPRRRLHVAKIRGHGAGTGHFAAYRGIAGRRSYSPERVWRGKHDYADCSRRRFKGRQNLPATVGNYRGFRGA